MDTIRRGGFNEPYCSDTCYENAGRRITEGLFSNVSGHCSFCQQSVTVSPVSPVKLIPYRNKFLFICPKCEQRGAVYVKYNISECCTCGKKLNVKPVNNEKVAIAMIIIVVGYCIVLAVSTFILDMFLTPNENALVTVILFGLMFLTLLILAFRKGL